MDDRSWMYRDSPQGLRRMDYCNGVQGFINFATSIPRNFTDGGIRCPCRKCKNLKFLHQDVVTMHLLTKGFMEDYMCWYAHGELFVPDESMEEQVVGSTSSASNMHEVGNENSNPYRNMVMDAMRMSEDNVRGCPIVEEEPNVVLSSTSGKKNVVEEDDNEIEECDEVDDNNSMLLKLILLLEYHYMMLLNKMLC